MRMFNIALLVGNVLALPAAWNDGSMVTSQQYANLVRNAKFAAAAYVWQCSHPPYGATLVQEVSDLFSDTQGYVARADDTKEIIVAMRGSSSIEDFFSDATTALVPCYSPGIPYPADARCHLGFQSSYNTVQNQFISLVSQQLKAHPGYTISVTGHSLGGSLSSIAALSMVYNFRNTTVTGYSYGQPRTGDVHYANFHDASFPLRNGKPSFYRAVHTTDGVPQVIRQGSDGSLITTVLGLFLVRNDPQATSGFRHHGTEFWQNVEPASQADTVQCLGQEDGTCQNSVYIFAPLLGVNYEHLTYFGIDFLNTDLLCQ